MSEQSSSMSAIRSSIVRSEKLTSYMGVSRYSMKCQCHEGLKTSLHYAVMEGNLESVTKLLEKDVDVNARDDLSLTPLHYAVSRNFRQIVSLLIKAKACIDAPFKNGTTAFYRAVKFGYLDIAKELFKNGACVNVSGKKRYTPLHYAALQGNESMAEALLTVGADINAETRENETPIYLATNMKQDKMVALLLKNCANVEILPKNGKTLFHLATEKLQLSTIDNILNHRPKIDLENIELLHTVAKLGYTKILQILLKLGANVNALDNYLGQRTILHTATLNRHYDIVVLLLRYGANPKAKDCRGDLAIDYAIENNDVDVTKLLMTASGVMKIERRLKRLFVAVQKKSPEIVEILLNTDDPNFDINATDNLQMTALHHTLFQDAEEFLSNVEACKKKKPRNVESMKATAKIVRILIVRGAFVDVAMRNGKTILHMALEVDYANVVEVLLANDANVNAIFKETGATPLHSAVKWNNLNVIKNLIDKGANVNATKKDGTTALHIASEIGHANVIRLLVERNANLNVVNNCKSTPLHLAAANGSRNAIETLLELGADIEAKDNAGKSALHIAAEYQCINVIQILLDNGADVNVTCNESMTPHDYADLTSNIDSLNDNKPIGPRFKYDNEDDIYFEHNPYNAVYDSSFCQCEDVAEFLQQHIIAIMAIDMYVSDKNLRAIDGCYMRREILEDCQNEIADMKTKKIGDINLYRLLTDDSNELARYASNDDIVDTIESKYFNDSFPIYSKIIIQRVRQGQKRFQLLRSSRHSIAALYGALPDVNAINVVENLSDKSLQNMIDASATILITIFQGLSCDGNIASNVSL